MKLFIRELSVYTHWFGLWQIFTTVAKWRFVPPSVFNCPEVEIYAQQQWQIFTWYIKYMLGNSFMNPSAFYINSSIGTSSVEAMQMINTCLFPFQAIFLFSFQWQADPLAICLVKTRMLGPHWWVDWEGRWILTRVLIVELLHPLNRFPIKTKNQRYN